jgi:curved DNA-binding protein CbpA
MAALNEAYAVLSDPQQRAHYDQRIARASLERRRSHERLLARLDDYGATWPWLLLFATVAFVTLAIGIAVYKNHVPGASAAAPISATIKPALKPTGN